MTTAPDAAGERADELELLPTEQPNPHTADLDQMTTEQVLKQLNDEDARVAGAVREALPEIARAVTLAHERWLRGGRVVLFGAGTSGRLALLDAAELGPTFGIEADRYVARMAGGPSAFLVAVEGAEDDPEEGARAAADLGPLDVAVGIAASGRTPWVHGALNEARQRGAATVAIACVPNPAIGRDSDVCIALATGPEAVAGSTRMKAGTAQKLVLNSFSTALMVRLGKVFGNLMVDVRATNEKLRRRAVRLVQRVAGVGPAEAERALIQSSWEVKTAVVVLGKSVPPAEARRLLTAAEGRLRAVLDA